MCQRLRCVQIPHAQSGHFRRGHVFVTAVGQHGQAMEPPPGKGNTVRQYN
jgi:hypothetical protein